MSIDPQDSWPDRETAEFENPFEGEKAQVGGSIEDLDAQAATQQARDEHYDAVDEAASETPVEEELRTVPWSKNHAWDGDTSFLAGLFEIGVVVNNTVPVIVGYDQLVRYGELSEEVQKRTVELTITERVLIYTALQVLGIMSGDRWRVQMDAILNRLEEIVEPTELEEAAIVAAEQIASRVYQEKLHEAFVKANPDVSIYTPEEFEQEMANPDTEDEHIKRLQAEQNANLN